MKIDNIAYTISQIQNEITRQELDLDRLISEADKLVEQAEQAEEYAQMNYHIGESIAYSYARTNLKIVKNQLAFLQSEILKENGKLMLYAESEDEE